MSEIPLVPSVNVQSNLQNTKTMNYKTAANKQMQYLFQESSKMFYSSIHLTHVGSFAHPLFVKTISSQLQMTNFRRIVSQLCLFSKQLPFLRER